MALSHNVGTRLLTRTADSKITEYEMIDTKNSSTAYVVMYEMITEWFTD